jgi:hypothetical protein
LSSSGLMTSILQDCLRQKEWDRALEILTMMVELVIS